jgi:hypothetical protein
MHQHVEFEKQTSSKNNTDEMMCNCVKIEKVSV